VFSSNPEKSKKDALSLGMDVKRIYPSVTEMLDGEASRKDGVDVVAIMTPNDSHFEYSMAALERGFDVICDKPMTNTLEEAETLHKKVQETGLIFCLTHNYTGYPMVRQAKAMVQDGQLGAIRLIQVEYVQGGKADEKKPVPAATNWKYDPARVGPSRVMGDIGTHAHNLARFVTGLEVEEVSAEVGSIVPGRSFHDFAGAMLHFEHGARGNFWVTQAAAGVENCLRIRVSGTKGSLEWMQEIPQALTFKPLHGPSQNRTPNGAGTLPLAARSSRIVAGHPEGFPDGFANIYSDAAEAISARRSGKQANPLALYFPNSWDGLLGIRFVGSVIESSNANGKWTKC
jgi:predicted dehydrogenase